MHYNYFSVIRNPQTVPLRLWIFIGTIGLILSSLLAQAQPCGTSIDFSSSVTTGPTQAANTWYTDRYAPAGFAAQSSFGGDDRLKHSIFAADGAAKRPSAFNTAFYNTQGRKLDLISGVKFVEIKLYIPSAWASSNKRMAGLWGTAENVSNVQSAYPILEFTSDGNNPRFRAYETGTGAWNDLVLPSGFTFDQWVTLKIQLLSSGEFRYTVVTAQGNLQATTTTSAPDASKQITNAILQGHNYDPAQPLDATNPGVTYDIYWDDFSAKLIDGLVINTTTNETFCSIQAAIDDFDTQDGHSITVSAGTYTEAITVNKALTIYGPNFGTLGTSTRVAEAVLYDGSINVTSSGPVVIDGFHIYQTNGIGDVILLGGGSTVTIQNSKIERVGTIAGQSVRAITTSAGSGAKTIQGNLFTGSTTGGFFSGHKTWNSGIYINGAGSTVNIIGNTFENLRSALNLDDYNSGITVSGNTFNPNGTHLSFGGSTPTSGSNTLGANEFKTPASGLVNLSNVDNTFRLDITSSTFNGAAFSTYPLPMLFLIESAMTHRGRLSSGIPRNGLVTYVAGHEYVVAGLTTIQSAVDYGIPGDVIHVKDGSFNEEVTVNKALHLKGANTGTPGNGTRVTESILTGNNGAHSGFVITASNVTIDGFTVTGAAGTYGAGIYSSPATSAVTIKCNIITDNVVGVYPSSNGASFVNNNLFNANNRAGASGGTGIYVEETNSLTVELNEFKGHTLNSAVIFGATAANKHQNLNFSRNYIHDNNDVNSMVYLNGINGGTFSYNNIVQSGTTAIKLAGGNSNVTLVYNELNNNTTAVKIQNDNGIPNTGIQIHENSLVSTTAINNLDVATVNATCNWYGSSVAGDVAAKVSGPVTYLPFTNSGTDNNGGGIGFEPAPNTCVYPVHNLTHAKDFATIQLAIDDAGTQSGDVIKVDAGTFTENFTVSKTLTFEGANKDVCGTASRGAETILNAPATETGVITLGGSVTATFNGVTINGLGVAYLTQPNQGLVFKNSVFNLNFLPGKNNLFAASNTLTLDCNYFQTSGGTNDGSSSHIFVAGGTLTAVKNKFTSIVPVNVPPVWLNITTNTSSFSVQNNEFKKIDIGILLAANAGNGIIQNNEFSEAKRASYTSGGGYGTGIAIFQNYTPSGPVSIQNNKFYASETGIRTSSGNPSNDFPTTSLLTISNNSFETISDGSFRIGNSFNSSVNPLQATCNWFNNAPVITGNPANITYVPKLVSGIDESSALGFQQTTPVCTGPVHNITQNTYFVTIQAAIDAPTTVANDVIEASDGTYNENVVVNKTLTIQGTSINGTIIQGAGPGSNVGVDIQAANVILKKLTVTNYNYGIRFSASGTAHKLIDLKVTSNGVAGIAVPYSAENVAISNLEITNVTSTSNTEGLEVFASVTGSKVFDNVTITNSNFSENKAKGIYIERANNLVIDNVTIDHSGYDLSNSSNNNGIDINLKFSTYSGITIKNSSITNSGYQGTTGAAVDGPSAIAVKARDDGATYGANPATLTGVTILNNVISGPQNGVRIGEYGKTNVSPSSVTVQNNDLSAAFANKAVINRTAANVTLICNYFGATDYDDVLAKLAAFGTGKNLLNSVATSTAYTSCITPTGLTLASSVTAVCVGTPSSVTAAGLLSSTSTIATYKINSGAPQTFTATTNAAGQLVVSLTLPVVSYTLTVTSLEANGIITPIIPPMSVSGVVKPNVVAGTVSGASTIGIGATTTYTNTGGTAGGTWSSSNSAIATVDGAGLVTGVASGTANIVYTVTGCGGPVSSQATVTVKAPNLTPSIVARPSTVYGTGTFTMVVDVSELNSVPTSGTVVVSITKDSKYMVTFNPTATSVNGRSVQNSAWIFNSSNPNFYTLTTTQSIPADGILSFGLNGVLVASPTQGVLTITAAVDAGGVNDVNFGNKSISTKINYFR